MLGVISVPKAHPHVGFSFFLFAIEVLVLMLGLKSTMCATFF